MYLEDEETLPTLIPISKKKNLVTVNEPEREHNSPVKTEQKTVTKNVEKQKDISSTEKKAGGNQKERQQQPLTFDKIEEFNNRFKAMNEEGRKKAEIEKGKIAEKWKEGFKAKELIEEMMHKINAKNITEELYPVTNQTIEALMKQTDEEIGKLNSELERKENSLSLNPKNLNLKQ